MFIRSVMFGETIYRNHKLVTIERDPTSTRVHVMSREMQDGTGRAYESWHSIEEDNTGKLSEAEEWVKGLEVFRPYEDSAQTALNEVLSILTDEQAETVPSAFPIWTVGSAYAVGFRVRYENVLYRCLQEHTSQEDWTPDATPSLWVRISDPAEEWPQWVQPTGAHDAYSSGSKVTHNNGHWISDVDGNVWEPGVYGWTSHE